MERREDGALECWSVGSAPDKSQICPAEHFYVSTMVLEKLGQVYGPGRVLPESNRESNWQRYGWELIRQVIGQERMVASKKQRGTGIAKLLKSLADDDIDILSAVLYHSREVFSLKQLKGTHLEDARVRLLGYCCAMARYWLNNLGLRESKRCPAVCRMKIREDNTNPPNIGSTRSRRTRRHPPDSTALYSSDKLQVLKTDSFIDSVVENNPAVSLEQVQGTMKDGELAKEVETIMRLQQSITNHEPHETQLTDDFEDMDEETFVMLKQSQLDEAFHIPVEVLQQWRSSCAPEYGHDEGCQVCSECEMHFSDLSELLIHLARSHYIPSMCSDSLP